MTPPATIAARHPTRTVRRGPAAPRPPRRFSGPGRPKRDPRAGATAATVVARPPFAMRLGARAMRVGDARVLDRLVRGRAWIAIMAIGLIGIVFMQVSLLKLNAGISRAVTAADTFDRQNSSLREDISKLDSGERIQSVAAKLGMVTPAAGDVHYLDGRGADGARAAAAIKPPDPVTPTAAPRRRRRRRRLRRLPRPRPRPPHRRRGRRRPPRRRRRPPRRRPRPRPPRRRPHRDHRGVDHDHRAFDHDHRAFDRRRRAGDNCATCGGPYCRRGRRKRPAGPGLACGAARAPHRPPVRRVPRAPAPRRRARGLPRHRQGLEPGQCRGQPAGELAGAPGPAGHDRRSPRVRAGGIRARR